MLDRGDLSDQAAGQYVDVYDFDDNRVEVRRKGVSLHFTVFDKDRRISHAAIDENKRLGAALTYIKAQHDAELPDPRIKTNSEAIGYRQKGHKPGRRTLPLSPPDTTNSGFSVAAE